MKTWLLEYLPLLVENHLLASLKSTLETLCLLPRDVCLFYAQLQPNSDKVWVIEQEFYKIWSLLSSWPVTLSNKTAQYPPEVQSFFDGMSQSLPVRAHVWLREKKRNEQREREMEKTRWAVTHLQWYVLEISFITYCKTFSCNFPVIKSWCTSLNQPSQQKLRCFTASC